MKTQKLYNATDHKSKTSLYIYDSLTEKMNKFLPEGTKTEFVNHAIAQEMARLEKEKIREDLLKFMKTIKPIKARKSTVAMVREVRNEATPKTSGKPNMALIASLKNPQTRKYAK